LTTQRAADLVAIAFVEQHQLANAAQSSTPTTQVLVAIRPIQRGVVVENDDGGVGLDERPLEQAREIASGRVGVDSLAGLKEKRTTTVALDFGRIHQPGNRAVPIVFCDARNRDSSVTELITLVEYALTSPDMKETS
jgi:hypothetical protein